MVTCFSLKQNFLFNIKRNSKNVQRRKEILFNNSHILTLQYMYKNEFLEPKLELLKKLRTIFDQWKNPSNLSQDNQSTNNEEHYPI